MRYRRLPIEIESPEELGYSSIANNLAESSFADMRLKDLGIDTDVGDLLLQYGDHRGVPALREAISDGQGIEPDDVLVTPGAAAALFLVASSLLQAGDHVIVVRPNYATNVETPRAIGADVEYHDLRFEEGWRLDLDALAARLRPDTRLVSLSIPNNPTGRTTGDDGLRSLIALVERHPVARLLVDETYRELTYGPPLPTAAALSPRALAVSSLSKSFGLPGLRIGWIACTDPALKELLLAAKEQVLLAGSIVDEELAARVLARRGEILAQVRATVAAHHTLVRSWMAGQRLFEWVEPDAGVVGFVRIREDSGVDVEGFYDALLARHGTYVGPGHWFEQDRRLFRLGFGWPTTSELTRGLVGLSAAAEEARAG